MSLESKYEKELEHSRNCHLNAFKLKKLLADNVLEYLPFCNNTARKSPSSVARGNVWLEKDKFWHFNCFSSYCVIEIHIATQCTSSSPMGNVIKSYFVMSFKQKISLI